MNVHPYAFCLQGIKDLPASAIQQLQVKLQNIQMTHRI